MSILPMNLDAVLDAFQHPDPLPCVDTLGTYVDGQWEEKETGQREINAVVLAMPVSKLEFYKEGDASAAGIILHTKDTLYFTDINNSGQEQRQSYIEYQGYRFRVVGTGFTLGNANFNCYEALRFFR